MFGMNEDRRSGRRGHKGRDAVRDAMRDTMRSVIREGMRRGGRGPGGGGMGGGFDAAEWDSEPRGRGRRRVFDGGELRLVLLKLIADSPRHGYDLIRAIEELTGGAYAPSPGIIYPTLTLLNEMGMTAELDSDGSRKLHGITNDGRAHLAENMGEVTAIFARLASLAALRERTDAAPVRRALHNLRNVLKARLGAGMADEQMHAAVALIDDAARKIEQL